MTNADKIRSMTDKELSELFGSWICDCDRNNFPCQEFCEMFDGKSCCERWLDWLKHEKLARYEDSGLEPEEVEAAKKIVARLALADYPNNFQLERSDIASYMYWISSVLKDAKELWNGMVTRDKEADR